MILDKNRLIDGQVSFERGTETHKSPSRVPRNQSTLLVNATTRQDFISPRPGWQQSRIVYETAATETAFENGLFQGASGYRPDSGPSYLILSISGRLFRVSMKGIVQEIALDQQNSSNRRQAWFCQAENFLVIQDGESKPIIWSGASARRSDVDGQGGVVDGHPKMEVPVGTVMEYSMGRLWVALPDGRSFVAGDAVYDPTGTATWKFRDAVLKFTENTFLATGGAFTIPTDMGKITAMKKMATLDTSLGEGPLQVFTSEGACSVNAPFDRELWKLVNYPIQTVSLLGNGATAQNSTVRVNSDIWYRSQSDIQPFILARRDFGMWGNRAMSHEVGRHLDTDNRELLRYGSACVFDNRLLMTVNPQYDRVHGTYHKGLVALDFHPLTSIGPNEPPSWEGLWTGLDILQILTVESEGVQRCFAVVLSSEKKIQIWELTLSERWNHAADGTRTRTTVVIESPRLDFGNRLEQKQLEGADIWLDKVAGEVDINLYYRPDEYPCWIFWKTFSMCATIERCSEDAIDGCLTDLNLKPQFRPRMSAQRPPESCLAGTNSPSRLGFGFQYRLEITGFAELTAIRLLANRIVESTFGSCLSTDADCREIVCCDESNLVSPVAGIDPNDIVPTSGGSSSSTTAGGGDPPEPPAPTYPTDGGYPVLTEFPEGWTGTFISEYGLGPIMSETPAGDLTYAKSVFWAQLIENEWEASHLKPATWSERYLAWDSVDTYFSNYGDFNAKFNANDPVPHPGDDLYSPGSFWRLVYIWR